MRHITNIGECVEDIHPFIIEGMWHTSISNIEAFSGGNNAISNLGESFDFIELRGKEKLTVTLSGCRMRNYVSNSPITVSNKSAVIKTVLCFDKEDKLFESK